jgi:hypothetical protein
LTVILSQAAELRSLELRAADPQARGVVKHDAFDILREATAVSASISSVNVILVSRTLSSSLRTEWAMLVTCGWTIGIQPPFWAWVKRGNEGHRATRIEPKLFQTRNTRRRVHCHKSAQIRPAAGRRRAQLPG